MVAASPRPRVGTLRAGRDVRRVLETGRRFPTRFLVACILPGTDGDALRAAFVAGRRVGRAVARNRARRLLREAWRANLPRVRAGYDVVFVARPGLPASRAADVTADMRRVLDASGVTA